MQTKIGAAVEKLEEALVSEVMLGISRRLANIV
jgi:tubulin-specific chaperone A